MPHPKVNRTALYARTALNAQTEDSQPIAAQLTSMRDFAAQRGWTIVAEFTDPHTNDRPTLQDLLAAVEEHTLDIILVYALATLSDSIFDTLAILETLGKHNVGFASVKEPQFDLTTPTGRPPLDLIANLGQYYDDLLHRRANRAKHQRSGIGSYTLTLHYGYQHDGDPQTPPVIVEKEAEAIRLAFERYAAGKDSYQDIANLLNESGYRTRRGRNFAKDTVASLLRNPFYAGKAVQENDTAPSHHNTIVTEGLWETAHHVRERHHHASRTSKHQTHPYLLNRIASCHICGRNLRVQSTATANFYREMPDPHNTCPNGQTGVRAEVLHRQIEVIVRELHLPAGWQEELEQAMVEENVPSLQSRRARLVALRRRLKEGYLRGDFKEDEDIYQRELARVRRELEQIPTEEDRYRVRQVVQLLDDRTGVWDKADAADLGNLIQLMLREVQVDVIQGRLFFLRPYAPFIPLFRSHPLLQERDVGRFTPVWPDELTTGQTLPPLTALPDEGKLVSSPFLPTWPWEPNPKTRISKPLGAALKARRKAGYEGDIAISVPQPGVPPILLDAHKWPDVSLEESTLAQALERPGGSVIFLDTPLVVQRHSAPSELVQVVYRLLAPEGHWHFVDIAPASMPAHWLFAFFPEAWGYVERFFRGTQELYTVLRRTGFQVEQREHTFYQPIALGVALKIARRRLGLLTALPDELYQEGLQRLEKTLGKQGDDALVPSEVTVVEGMAKK
ncbi:MAG: recombinase family protein [Chloroflexi bacterium]|nr:recombinase family protein [Chloroflexota bacterium]